MVTLEGFLRAKVMTTARTAQKTCGTSRPIVGSVRDACVRGAARGRDPYELKFKLLLDSRDSESVLHSSFHIPIL
jgi:hypothetical protein